MIALVLVDIQNDFLPGGPLAVPHGDAIVAPINRLLPAYDLVVATQDWHPPNHGSFAANHPGCQVGQLIDLHGLPQLLWPVHCVQDTRGAAFPDTLNAGRIQGCFHKGTDPTVDSYSGFFDNGHRQATGLADFLRVHQVGEVHLAGLATDYCVKFTALDARDLGFETGLLNACCRGVELHSGDSDRAIRDMVASGVRLLGAGQPTA